MRVVAACSDHRCALRGSYTSMQQRGDTTLRDWCCAPAWLGPQQRGASEPELWSGLGGGVIVGELAQDKKDFGEKRLKVKG